MPERELSQEAREDKSGRGRREEVRRWGFGQEVKKRVLAGTHTLTAG